MTTVDFSGPSIYVKPSFPLARRNISRGKQPKREKAKPLTWAQMCDLEQGLVVLESEIRRCTPPKGQVYWRRWEGFKARLRFFVGCWARNPTLGDSEAYELAYKKLFDLYESRKTVRLNKNR